jgi:hypothetical protein
MTHFLTPCTALVLLLPAAARGELVAWSYDWGSRTGSVAATGGAATGGTGTGGISFATPTGTAVGTSDIVAANLTTFSSAPSGTPDTFSNTPYRLDVKLTDPSGAAGVLTFGGRFRGTLTPTSANITNDFDGPTAKSIHLGDNTYTVILGAYIAPGAPNSTTTGSIGAHVDVVPGVVPTPTPAPGPASATPEPSTLVLAGMGLLALGARAWRRGRSPAVGSA